MPFALLQKIKKYIIVQRMGTYRHERPNLLQEFKMFLYIWPLALVVINIKIE